MKYKVVVFDLDGTLLDTILDLHNCINYSLTINNYKTRSLNEIRSFIGNGIRKLVERSLPINTSDNIVNKVYNDLINYYEKNYNNKTKPFFGIVDIVNKLFNNNYNLAVLTNKNDSISKNLINYHFKDKFKMIIGDRDNKRRKPYPDSVFEIKNYFNVSNEEVVLIGDSDVDIITASNSGIDCIAVTWGYKDVQTLKDLKPKYLINNIAELKSIFFEE